MILERRQFPEHLNWIYVRGVSLWSCIATGERLPDGEFAHAHFGDQWRGWICFRHAILIHDELICAHELAHLIVEWEGYHGPKWREMVLHLGGTLDPVECVGQYTYDYHRDVCPRRYYPLNICKCL